MNTIIDESEATRKFQSVVKGSLPYDAGSVRVAISIPGVQRNVKPIDLFDNDEQKTLNHTIKEKLLTKNQVTMRRSNLINKLKKLQSQSINGVERQDSTILSSGGVNPNNSESTSSGNLASRHTLVSFSNKSGQKSAMPPIFRTDLLKISDMHLSVNPNVASATAPSASNMMLQYFSMGGKKRLAPARMPEKGKYKVILGAEKTQREYADKIATSSVAKNNNKLNNNNNNNNNNNININNNNNINNNIILLKKEATLLNVKTNTNAITNPLASDSLPNGTSHVRLIHFCISFFCWMLQTRGKLIFLNL